MTSQELGNYVFGEGHVYTYIVEACGTGLYKIGISRNIDNRMTSMQTDCPFELRIMWHWPEDVERELHDLLDKYRVRGEWFRVDINTAIAWAAIISKEKFRQREFGRVTISGLYPDRF